MAGSNPCHQFIQEEVAKLRSALANCSVGADHCAHIGPLIRREETYSGMSRDERQRIFGLVMAFMRRIDIAYKCFSIDKHFNNRETAVHDVLLQGMNRFLGGEHKFRKNIRRQFKSKLLASN